MRGALIVALRLFGQASRLLIVVYVGRELGATALGTYGIVAATSGLLVTLVGLEYHQYAARALLQAAEADRAAIVAAQVRMFGYGWMAAVALLCFVHFGRVLPAYTLGWIAIIALLSHFVLECQRLFTVLGRPVAAYAVNACVNGAWVLPWLACALLVPKVATLSGLLAAWSIGAAVGGLIAAIGLVRGGVLRGASWRSSSLHLSGLRSGLTHDHLN